MTGARPLHVLSSSKYSCLFWAASSFRLLSRIIAILRPLGEYSCLPNGPVNRRASLDENGDVEMTSLLAPLCLDRQSERASNRFSLIRLASDLHHLPFATDRWSPSYSISSRISYAYWNWASLRPCLSSNFPSLGPPLRFVIYSPSYPCCNLTGPRCRSRQDMSTSSL